MQDGGKAIRYGVTVGEEALAFSGIAKVGNMDEWPKWTPTADIHKRIEGLPASVPGGVDNPLGARALYLYQGSKDTLFRIHGTNQPEYIGASISSGCIRMTNEDVIDLYSRVKMGIDRRRARAQAGRLALSIRRVALQGGEPDGSRFEARPADASAQSRSSGAPVLPALFLLPGFCSRPARASAGRSFSASGFTSGGALSCSGFRISLASRLGSSDPSSQAWPATSRGGASSGRSAGNNGAICGSGSHTSHWQIR